MQNTDSSGSMWGQVDLHQMHRFLSDLREKIEDGTLGLPPPEPLGEGGPNLHCFFLRDKTFALMPWMQKTTLKGRKNSQIQDLKKQEDMFGTLVSRFKVLLGTIETRPKVVRDSVFTCMMLHNMLWTHQGSADRALTSANDVAAL